MTAPCRIVYMGTPEFAVPSLEAIQQSRHELLAVVTAPDRPAGRGRKLRPSPVKESAVRLGIPVLQPEKLRTPGFIESLRDLHADIFVVVAFRMLPRDVWSLPRLGTVNLHASLLPDYRGAAPINHAIINGEERSGLTTFLIDEKIDTGDILMRREMGIGPDETAGELHDRMMLEGPSLLLDTIERLASGKREAIAQDSLSMPAGGWHSAPKIFPDDTRIDWTARALTVRNLIRGLSPYPGAHTLLDLGGGEKAKLKILRASVAPGQAPTGTGPGDILSDGRNFIDVMCTDAAIRIDELQLEGKRRMHTADFLRGFDIQKSHKAC